MDLCNRCSHLTDTPCDYCDLCQECCACTFTLLVREDPLDVGAAFEFPINDALGG